MVKYLSLLLILLGFGAAANAQLTQNVTVTSTVPQVLNLAIDTTSVALPFATTDYNAVTGIATQTASAATTLSVSSNRGWLITVKAATSTFAFTPSAGDTNPSKPCGDLSVKLSSSGTFDPVSTTNATLATGARGGTGETGNAVMVDYHLTSNLKNDPPGSYSLGLIYTLTSP